MHAKRMTHTVIVFAQASGFRRQRTCICFARAFRGRLAARSATSVTAATSVCASAGLCEAAASLAAWCSSCASLFAERVILKRPELGQHIISKIQACHTECLASLGALRGGSVCGGLVQLLAPAAYQFAALCKNSPLCRPMEWSMHVQVDG